MSDNHGMRLHAFARRARAEIAANAVPALAVASAAVLPFLPFVLHVGSEGQRSLSGGALMVAAGAVLLALLSRLASLALALVYLPLTLLSVHLVRHYSAGQHGWRLNQVDSRVEAYFESPSSETFEYLRSQGWPSDWVLVGAAVLYLVALAWLLRRMPPLTTAARWAVVAATAAWAVIAVQQRIDRHLPQWPQYQLALAAIEARPRFAQLAERNVYLEANPLPPAECGARYRHIVVVLGESANSDHMSVFGYRRKTTPFAERSSPHAFLALAPANQTRYSLAMMLTAVRPGEFAPFYRLHSLVGRLAACGYRTLWISNQGRVGRQDSMAASLAREADRHLFLNELSYKQVGHDGEILQALENLGAFEAERQATFIHLIGSHMQYARRFPARFGFRPILDTVDAYDNSILYTDHVLAELHERFGPEGLLLVYAADHGEVVANRGFGHGFSPGFQEEYRVPLLIWTEDTASMGRLKAAVGNARLNLASFDDVMLYLAGSTESPAVSTSGVVTNLGPANRVNYHALPSAQRPASESRKSQR